MEIRIWILSALYSIVFFGCNQTKSEMAVEGTVAEMSSTPAAISDNVVAKTTEELSNYDRKVIKNASLSFESGNPAEKVQFITSIVAKNNGYIISNNQSKYDNYIEQRVNFKIPFNRFDAILPELENNCGILIHKNVSSDDVTEEFYDNESQLKAKKELENRYIQLVKQAKTIKDMMELEEKLSEVRTEIECIEGRQRFLNNNTQFSTFDISIVDNQNTVSNNYFHKLWNSIQKGIDHLFSFILWFIEISPFILIGLGIFYWIRKKKGSFQIFKKKKD